jgi:hypothetical protein
VASYILVYISAMVLRKRIPIEEYKFKAPGGYGFLKLICIVPICVAVFSFFINGTDYFLGGMIGIISGPILYIIWKRIFGGLAVKDPVAYPVDAKSKLAVGDYRRISFLFLVLGVIGVGGWFFLPWYESGWSFPDDYDMKLFASQSAMWLCIRVLALGSFAVSAIFYALSRKEDPISRNRAV